MKKKLLSTLANFEKFGTGICFERISLAYDLLKLRSYFYTAHITVITGTNGKGSTANALSNLLVSAGKETGLFTSPHFIEFNERFIHQGKPIDYQTLNQQMDRLLPIVQQIQTILSQKFGTFEVLFLLALCVFESKKIAYLVIEAGIGGRFDPVRTLQAPLCALTSVDLEHTELLGKTIEAIACDKLDATPPKGHCVIGQLTPNINNQDYIINHRLESTLAAYAEASEFTTSRAEDEVSIAVLNRSANKTAKQLTLRINLNDPTLPPFNLTVAHLSDIQILNWQSALALYKRLSKLVKLRDQNANLSCHPKIIEQALNTPSLSGRFQTIAQNPTIIVDSAHTPNAYRWLFNTIKADYQDKPCIFVVGLSIGRNIEQFKHIISSLDSTIVTTQAHNGIDAQQLANQLDSQWAFADIADAIDQAKQIAHEQDGRIFIVGGLFLGASASAYLQGLPYKDLNF